MQTALHSLPEKVGYEETTFRDIAAAAQVSRSTISRRFESNEAFLLAGHPQRIGLLREELSSRVDRMPAFEATRESFVSLARFRTANAEKILVSRCVIHSSPTLTARDALLSRD